MSEPVSNVEIEDVLSSIRRLVSENNRAPDVARVSIAAQSPVEVSTETVVEPFVDTPIAAPVEAPVEKLVLTPALRIADVDEIPAVEFQIDYSNGFETEVGEAPEIAVYQDDEAQMAELADHDAQEDHGFSLDFSGDVSTEYTDTTIDVGPEIKTAVEAEVDIAVEGIIDTSVETVTETLAGRIAGLETAVAGQDDQWEPDGDGGNDEYAGGPVEAFEFETLTWEDHVENDDDEIVMSSPEPFSADETHAAIDMADVEAYDDDALDVEPSDEFEALNDEPEIDLFASDDAILDEGALREMVAEIVRQELQGSLGERITRNVRKLVRREIHRALASQDLE